MKTSFRAAAGVFVAGLATPVSSLTAQVTTALAQRPHVFATDEAFYLRNAIIQPPFFAKQFCLHVVIHFPSHLFSSPCSSLSLPSYNSDPGSRIRRFSLSSPLRVLAWQALLWREDCSPFFPRQLAPNCIYRNPICVFTSVCIVR